MIAMRRRLALVIAAVFFSSMHAGCTVSTAVPAPVAAQGSELDNPQHAAELQQPVAPQLPAKAEVERVEAISYDDLDIPLPADSVFHDWMLTQRVRDLDGRTIRIKGYIHAGSVFATEFEQFILVRDSDCPFGAGGHAHHAIHVQLGAFRTRYTTRSVTVEGRLSVKPFTGENGNTWSVYHIAATSVTPD
jgi:hypothetical protein